MKFSLPLYILYLFETVKCRDECVQKIIEKYYTSESLIALVDTNIQLVYPVIHQNSHEKEMVIFNHLKPDMYIITLSGKNLTKTIEFLEQMDMFNSRAKFVILTNFTDYEGIFHQLPLYFIYNAVVLNSEDLLTTYNPFIFENVEAIDVQPLILGQCTSLDFSTINCFNVDFPKYWRNTTVSSIYAEHFPYVFLQEGKLVGENYQVLLMVQEQIKFKLSVKNVGDQINSPDVDLLDLLQRGRNHLVVNHKTTPLDKYLDFDLVPTNLAGHFFWVVPKPKGHMSYWRIFIHKYDLAVWSAIMFFLLLSSIVWYQLEETTLIYSVLLHCQMFLETSNLRIVKVSRLSTRILTTTVVLSFLVISATFKSEMMQSFTTYIQEFPINSLDVIMKKNMSCYVTEDLMNLYQSADDVYADYVSHCSLLEEDDSQEELMVNIAREQNAVTISRLLKFKFAVNKLLSMGYETPPLHLIRPQIKFDFLHIHLKKGFPIYNRFLEVVRRMHSSGFTSYFRKNVDYAVSKALKSKEIIISKNLTLQHISIAFYVVITGLGISTVVFLLELLINKIF